MPFLPCAEARQADDHNQIASSYSRYIVPGYAGARCEPPRGFLEAQAIMFCEWKGNKDVNLLNAGMQRLPSRHWKNLLVLIAALGLIASSFGLAMLFGVATTPALAAGSLPCDIYASGGTPCVAAHSTVRALFSAYNGNLYQVRRASDNTTLNIGVLSAGGFANASAQDSFCAGTSCVVTIVYDQSGRGNHLAYQGP